MLHIKFYLNDCTFSKIVERMIDEIPQLIIFHI